MEVKYNGNIIYGRTRCTNSCWSVVTMSAEVDLLLVLGNKENYNRFSPRVKEHSVQPETWNTIQGIGKYFESHPSEDQVDWRSFSSWFTLVFMPNLKADDVNLYKSLYSRLSTSTTPTNDSDLVQHFIKLDYALQIYDMVQDIIEGNSNNELSDINSILDTYNVESGLDRDTDFITTDIAEILNLVMRVNGIKWRLEDLNVGIGPVHFGDYIVVAARPETGKTSFITSEVSHMLKQIPIERPCLFINNEEQGEKIMFRMIQSTINQDAQWIESNEALAVHDYINEIGDKDRFLVRHEPDISTNTIERLIQKTHAGIIVLNVVDKIQRPRRKGKQTNEVEELRQLHVWARGIASKYNCLVIGVVQADTTAEGEKWIYQNQLYGSKTGVQGEADVLITIGRTRDPSEAHNRFIHVPKNKLPGDANCDPTRKHGYFTVEFDALRGRYETIEFRHP